MRHKFLVLSVNKLLKSVHIYGSYRKIKTGVPFFGTAGIIRGQAIYWYHWNVSQMDSCCHVNQKLGIL